jgi:mRNA interferase MazF
MITGMMNNILEPQRGEIWWIKFNPTQGDEIGKIRPGIVISINSLSEGGLRVKLVVPITGWRKDFSDIPWLVPIEPSELNGLQKLSTANPLQTRAISVGIARFGDKLGRLEDAVLEQVVLALALVTGLGSIAAGEIDRL